MVLMVEDESRQGIHNPWGLRERVTPLRTYSGRVVYDRPPHSFSLADLERITKKIQTPLDRGELPPKGFFDRFLLILRDLWALMTRSLIRIPPFPVEDIFEYIVWVARQNWEDIIDPFAAVRDKTYLVLVLLIDTYDLGERIGKRYK